MPFEYVYPPLARTPPSSGRSVYESRGQLSVAREHAVDLVMPTPESGVPAVIVTLKNPAFYGNGLGQERLRGSNSFSPQTIRQLGGPSEAEPAQVRGCAGKRLVD